MFKAPGSALNPLAFSTPIGGHEPIVLPSQCESPAKSLLAKLQDHRFEIRDHFFGLRLSVLLLEKSAACVQLIFENRTQSYGQGQPLCLRDRVCLVRHGASVRTQIAERHRRSFRALLLRKIVGFGEQHLGNLRARDERGVPPERTRIARERERSFRGFFPKFGR